MPLHVSCSVKHARPLNISGDAAQIGARPIQWNDWPIGNNMLWCRNAKHTVCLR